MGKNYQNSRLHRELQRPPRLETPSSNWKEKVRASVQWKQNHHLELWKVNIWKLKVFGHFNGIHFFFSIHNHDYFFPYFLVSSSSFIVSNFVCRKLFYPWLTCNYCDWNWPYRFFFSSDIVYSDALVFVGWFISWSKAKPM